MSACRRGSPIFILKTAFKNINQAQQNANVGFSLKCCKTGIITGKRNVTALIRWSEHRDGATTQIWFES